MSLGSCYPVKDVPLTKDELNPASVKEGAPEVFSTILSESEDGKIIRGMQTLLTYFVGWLDSYLANNSSSSSINSSRSFIFVFVL